MGDRKFWQKVIIVCLVTFSNIVLAADLKASVQSNTVVFGHSFVLKLVLEDAKAIQAIDFSALTKDFVVHGQQQFSTYSNNNGKVAAEEGWYISLLARKDGNVTIPVLSVMTNKGKLSSLPINMNITKGASGKQSTDSVLGVSLLSTVNKVKPYVNEPVVYTFKIISYRPLGQLTFDEIKSSNAIIEKMGEPKQYDQVVDGVAAHIIELKYAITPLKSGKITIHPATVYGEMQMPLNPSLQRNMRYGLFNDLFLDQMYEMQPFNVRGEEIVLNVLPPVANSKDSWLPLQHLSITEQWQGLEDVKVGDTITRKVRVIADGTFGQQLPGLRNMENIAGAKVYTNKPVILNDIARDGGYVIGSREEEFSIVPVKAGMLTIPEIKIAWWNMRTRQWSMSTLPAKTIQVAATGANETTNEAVIDYSQAKKHETAVGKLLQEKKNNSIWSVFKENKLILGLILVLSLIIMFLSALVWTLRKRGRSGINSAANFTDKINVNKKTTITDVASLKNYIMEYASDNWGVDKQLALGQLGMHLSGHGYNFDLDKYATLQTAVNGALYAKRQVDLILLMHAWEEFKASVRKLRVKEVTTSDQDDDLNPT